MNTNSNLGERSRGLYGWLSTPAIYDWVQWMVVGPKFKKWQKLFVEEFVVPQPGCKILDIGCGTGTIVDILPNGLNYDYCGFDLNPEYIDAAKTRYGHKGSFFCQRVSDASLEGIGPFDIVFALGILHHLGAEEAISLMELAHRALVVGGRLLTYDPALVQGQSRLARLLVSSDRGKHVRDPNGYSNLALGTFATVQGTVLHNMLRVPYTHFVMKCVK